MECKHLLHSLILSVSELCTILTPKNQSVSYYCYRQTPSLCSARDNSWISALINCSKLEVIYIDNTDNLFYNKNAWIKLWLYQPTVIQLLIEKSPKVMRTLSNTIHIFLLCSTLFLSFLMLKYWVTPVTQRSTCK